MAGDPKTPSKIEKTISKTIYTVTSHFQPKGLTAEQVIKHLIHQGTKSEND